MSAALRRQPSSLRLCSVLSNIHMNIGSHVSLCVGFRASGVGLFTVEAFCRVWSCVYFVVTL